MTTLVLVVRGLRSRALLSAAALVLMVVALAGTVLGPAFRDGVTASYTATRLADADAPLTALTFESTSGPGGTLAELAEESVAAVEEVLPDAYADPDVLLRAGPFVRTSDAVGFRYVYREGACELLDVEGRCPRAAGEVLIHEDDLSSRAIGDVVELPRLGRQTVVGTYATPPDSTDWLVPGRLASRPLTARLPYEPGPTFVTEDVLAALPRERWGVVLDSRLVVPDGIDDTGLDRLVAGVERALVADLTLPGGGRVVGASDLNSLPAVLDDVHTQRDAARSTMTPAVVSLALLALAVILRLQAAAAEQRAPELALAALRGLSARRTWLLGLAEPWLLLALATPLGVLGGYAAARGLSGAWLRPGTEVALPSGSWVGAVLVVVAIAAVSAYAVGQGLRETLAARVAGVRRPAGADGPGRAGIVVEVLLVALAVVLPLARVGRDTGPGSELGLADLLLPVVTAVAAGLLVTRATGAAAGWWTRRSSGGPMSVFVAARALARRSQGTLVILPVAAAIAVAVFATGISSVAAGWRGSVAATTAPGDEVWSSPLSPGPTQRVTHDVDPDGRWAMSIARLTAPDAAPVVMVDSERLVRVGRWSEQWLDGGDSATAARLVAPAGPLVRMTGDRVSLTGETTGGPVTVVLVVDSGAEKLDFLRLGPFGADGATRTTETDLCRRTCEVREVRLEGDSPVRLSALAVDGEPVDPGLSAAGWTSAEGEPAALEDDALVVAPGTDLVPAVASGPLPVLVGVDASLSDAERSDGVDLVGAVVAVTEVARAESLPLVGPAGLLVDETSLLARIDPDLVLATSSVLVRSDAPDSVRDGLREAGLTRAPGYPETRRALDDGAYGQALRLYLVVAAILLAMALGGLLVSTAVQLPARRRDAAALRVVGVRRRTVVLASLWESVVVLGAAALAGLAAGALAERVLVGSLTLGQVEDPATPAVLPVTDAGGLLLLVGGVVVVLLAVAVLTSTAVVRGARGATLRESAR